MFFYKFFQCTFLIEKYQKLGVDTSSFTERVQHNLQWSKDFGNNITNWLVKHSYDKDGQAGGGESKMFLSSLLILLSVIMTFFNFLI